MDSREIIRRNLDFDNPERIGLAFYDQPERRWNDIIPADLGPSSARQSKRWTEGEFEYYDDEWGNIWHRITGRSLKGEICKPALEDWSALEDLRLPDYTAPERYIPVREAFKAAPGRYRMGILSGGFPFAICRYLRRMEIYFQDLLLEREKIDRLHDMVAGLLEKTIHCFADAGADGIFFGEDWGVQDRLLISPATWRDIFKPIYRRLCNAAHERGMHMLMHSCGYNADIFDDLAEVGVNAFQFDQTELYGLEWLAGKLRELKVCLYSPVDIQRTLQTGDRDLIEGTARRMVELFGGRRGGFIAKNYGDLKGIGVEKEWDRWAYEAFLEGSRAAVKSTSEYRAGI